MVIIEYIDQKPWIGSEESDVQNHFCANKYEYDFSIHKIIWSYYNLDDTQKQFRYLHVTLLSSNNQPLLWHFLETLTSQRCWTKLAYFRFKQTSQKGHQLVRYVFLP